MTSEYYEHKSLSLVPSLQYRLNKTSHFFLFTTNILVLIKIMVTLVFKEILSLENKYLEQLLIYFISDTFYKL